MQNLAVTVEANLIAKRNRARNERRTTFKKEPLALEQKLDAIINGMHRLGDRLESVERKSSWEGQQQNTTRSPNFRKNQNPNVGRASPDHDIRPPFEENYTEASPSCEPTEETHMNLLDLKGEQQIFLTREDQDDHEISQFQTKSGESFDFKQGYDSAVYEVHKQYKLRTRTIDIPASSKPKEDKQPNRIKGKVIVTEPADITFTNPHQVTVEDITVMQPSIDQPLPSFSLKENPNSTPKDLPKTEIPQTVIPQNNDNQKENPENTLEKEKSATANTKISLEKPFNLEVEIKT